MANSVDPDQTVHKGAVCSGSTLFASILIVSVMLGNYFQQTTFSDAFFLGALRVNFQRQPIHIYCQRIFVGLKYAEVRCVMARHLTG